MTTILIAKTHPETGGQDKTPQLKTTPAAFIKEIPFRKHIYIRVLFIYFLIIFF